MARNDITLRARKARALQQAIEEAGGLTEVSKFITANFEPISPQGVANWDVCPPLRAGQLAAAAQAKGGKVTVADLCPDFAKIFAPKPRKQPVAGANGSRRKAEAA